MTFFRLLKPDWGKEFLERDGKKVKNPDFVRTVKGPNTLEGCFDEKYIARKNKEGYNIYWFPNHPAKNIYTEEKKYLNGRDINVFEHVFVDMDLKDGVYKSVDEFLAKLAEFPLKPTLVMASGNGVHAYWSISDLTRDDYVFTQKRLIKHFNTDPSIFTVLQIMRFPGSFNTKKHDEFKKTMIATALSGGGPYKIKEIQKLLPKLTDEEKQKAQNHLDKLDGKITMDFGGEVNLDELPDKFIKLLKVNRRVKTLFEDVEQGQRSEADASLTNILYLKGFTEKEAFAVISNSKKALSKGPNRYDYAINTIQFVWSNPPKGAKRKEEKKKKLKNTSASKSFKTVGEKLKAGIKSLKGERVNGPVFFDCLYNGWRKSQVLGMIAGSGVGKTSAALKVFYDMIKNNDDDDVFVFFSLEMPEHEIEERWINLVGKNTKLANRLFVIGNEDEEGEPRNISLQDIYFFCEKIKKETGKNIKSVVIDHIGIINNVIDIEVEPSFNAEGDVDGGRGSRRALSLPNLMKAMKPLAKMLDTFLIVLTQTTKTKGGGDVPIDKDGAFGSAAYEWMMDYILTLWQPLMRVQQETDMRILAWQYAKIRSKNKRDPIQSHQMCLLHYDLDSGDLRPITGEEHAEFERLLPAANEARKAAEKKESNAYTRGPSLKDLEKLKNL
jgi:hypothetical protein